MAKAKITERDIRVIECLDRYALMTSQQIHNSQFQSTDIRTMLRRLRLLEQRNLIQRHHGLQNGKLVWSATKKGLTLTGSDYVVTVNRNAIEHDSMLTEVRVLLDRLGIGKNWKGSHDLRLAASADRKPEDRDADVIPDGLFGVVRNNEARFVALEVELTAKARKRYRRILDLYGYKKAINHIWYVIKSPKLGESLLKEVERLQRTMPEDWLAWTTIEDLLSNELEAKVHFQNGKWLTLKNFAPPSRVLKAANTLPTQAPTR